MEKKYISLDISRSRSEKANKSMSDFTMGLMIGGLVGYVFSVVTLGFIWALFLGRERLD
jgi:hypothetical protein